jgi:hypothetical protein
MQWDPSLISINSLEYAAQLITMLGCHLHGIKTAATRHDPNPILLLECDNTAGQSWLAKGCTSSITGHALARLQAYLLLDQGAGYSFGCVDTKTNVIADGISHVPSELALPHEFPLLLAQAPSLHMAAGATTQVPPSSCRLWTSSCGLTAWILSW